jgi:hypothetical protein
VSGGRRCPSIARRLVTGQRRLPRVPRQAISEIEALYERRNLADLRPVLQDSTQSLPARLKPESPRSWSISVAARWPVSRAVAADRVEVGPEPLSVNRQSTRECLIAAHIGSWASLWALTSHSASLTDHPRSVMSPQTTWCLPASRAVATFQAVESRLPERPGDCPRVVTLTRGPRR